MHTTHGDRASAPSGRSSQALSGDDDICEFPLVELGENFFGRGTYCMLNRWALGPWTLGGIQVQLQKIIRDNAFLEPLKVRLDAKICFGRSAAIKMYVFIKYSTLVESNART